MPEAATQDQHQVALVAALYREIRDLPDKEALAVCADAIESGSRDFDRLQLKHLLSKLPGWGPRRLEEFGKGVSLSVAIGSLTRREREAVAEAVRLDHARPYLPSAA